MTPLTFSKNSWHAWLVKHFTPRYLDEFDDLCSYIRWLLLGIIVFLFVVAVVMSILTGFSWDIAYLLGYVNYINEEKQKALWAALNGWQHYWYISAFVTNVFLGVGAVVSGIGLCALTIQKIQNRKGVSKTQKRPGFLKASYLTFKDKVCFKVNFK